MAGAAPAGALKLTADDYQVRDLGGWRVYVQKDLTNYARLEASLEYLERDLSAVSGWLPKTAMAELRQVPIWLSRNANAGAAYHPSREWLESHGRVPEMARAIEIQNIDHFLDWRKTQPAMVLHELAHAWHHRKFGFKDPAITAAFQQAVDRGGYEKVRHWDGGERRHYALTNEKEYFAELTEAYFARNDFFPFDRKELRGFDPAGLRMVEQVWGITATRNDSLESKGRLGTNAPGRVFRGDG